MPCCSREIFTKLCRLINAGKGAFQDSFHAIVITAKLMYMMEHHWQRCCLGGDSPLHALGGRLEPLFAFSKQDIKKRGKMTSRAMPPRFPHWKFGA